MVKYLKGECQHCGGHLEFPAEHAGLAADCPHCGQSTELLLARPPAEPSGSLRGVIWALVALVILGAGLGACLVALHMAERKVARYPRQAPVKVAETTPPASAANDPLTQQGFSVSPIQLEHAPGTSLVYATATLRNLQNRQRFGVKVELELDNAAGQKLGTATDYQQVLEPGADWKFRALVVDTKTTTAKLASVKEDQ